MLLVQSINASARALAPRLIVLLFAVAVTGCTSWPDRETYSASQLARASVIPQVKVRFWADPSIDELAEVRQHFEPLEMRGRASNAPLSILALSSGSDSGAYAAGLLAGWTASGSRPQFDLVTGVSTGALIAPFAFLGPNYDEDLRSFYTETRRKDVFRPRLPVNALTGPSLTNSRPLRELIEMHVDETLLDRIAQEHGSGRRLLVMTTNLDAGRGAIWDLGAIAASNSPERLELFRDILQASASVPGIFTPVLISSFVGGKEIDELHVDGATHSGIFLLPEPALLGEGTLTTPANLYLILNSEISPKFELVEPNSLSILGRALDVLIHANNRAALIQIYSFTKRSGWEFNLSAIESDFAREKSGWFEPEHMRALYDYGKERGADAEHWRNDPALEVTD